MDSDQEEDNHKDFFEKIRQTQISLQVTQIKDDKEEPNETRLTGLHYGKNKNNLYFLDIKHSFRVFSLRKKGK